MAQCVRSAAPLWRKGYSGAIVPTRFRKRLILGSAAVVAALVLGVVLVPGTEAVSTRYNGVMRVPMPNFTRVEMPGAGAGEVSLAAAADPAIAAEAAAELGAEGVPVTQGEPGAAPAAARPAPGNIIPVRFDIQSPGLGDEVVGGDAIVVRKSVRIGTREVGKLPIHVDSRSRLLVRPSDLRAMLEKAGQDEMLGDRASSNELRSLGDLRKDGLDLRYDPNSDSVVLTVG